MFIKQLNKNYINEFRDKNDKELLEYIFEITKSPKKTNLVYGAFEKGELVGYIIAYAEEVTYTSFQGSKYNELKLEVLNIKATNNDMVLVLCLPIIEQLNEVGLDKKLVINKKIFEKYKDIIINSFIIPQYEEKNESDSSVIIELKSPRHEKDYIRVNDKKVEVLNKIYFYGIYPWKHVQLSVNTILLSLLSFLTKEEAKNMKEFILSHLNQRNKNGLYMLGDKIVFEIYYKLEIQNKELINETLKTSFLNKIAYCGDNYIVWKKKAELEATNDIEKTYRYFIDMIFLLVAQNKLITNIIIFDKYGDELIRIVPPSEKELYLASINPSKEYNHYLNKISYFREKKHNEKEIFELEQLDIIKEIVSKLYDVVGEELTDIYFNNVINIVKDKVRKIGFDLKRWEQLCLEYGDYWEDEEAIIDREYWEYQKKNKKINKLANKIVNVAEKIIENTEKLKEIFDETFEEEMKKILTKPLDDIIDEVTDIVE